MGLLCLSSAWHASPCVTAPDTHPSIDPSLCGELVSLAPGVAEVELRTEPRMAADPVYSPSTISARSATF